MSMSSTTVLVGIAGDDEARVERYAETLETLARNGGVNVVLTHIYAESDLERIEEMYDIDSREPHHLSAAAERNTAVRKASALLDERDVDYDVRGSVGDPSAQLVEVAREVGADFVLIGGRKRSATGKALFGSTAQSVLMNAPCPVIFAGPATEW